MSLTADDIEIGAWYRAKRPCPAFGAREFNDRRVVYVSLFRTEVHFDGPAFMPGRALPVVRMESFLKWAGAKISDE
jgi:hypothetical protein